MGIKALVKMKHKVEIANKKTKRRVFIVGCIENEKNVRVK